MHSSHFAESVLSGGHFAGTRRGHGRRFHRKLARRSVVLVVGVARRILASVERCRHEPRPHVEPRGKWRRDVYGVFHAVFSLPVRDDRSRGRHSGIAASRDLLGRFVVLRSDGIDRRGFFAISDRPMAGAARAWARVGAVPYPHHIDCDPLEHGLFALGREVSLMNRLSGVMPTFLCLFAANVSLHAGAV
jgi:hypothetical protein